MERDKVQVTPIELFKVNAENEVDEMLVTWRWDGTKWTIESYGPKDEVLSEAGEALNAGKEVC